MRRVWVETGDWPEKRPDELREPPAAVAGLCGRVDLATHLTYPGEKGVKPRTNRSWDRFSIAFGSDRRSGDSSLMRLFAWHFKRCTRDFWGGVGGALRDASGGEIRGELCATRRVAPWIELRLGFECLFEKSKSG